MSLTLALTAVSAAAQMVPLPAGFRVQEGSMSVSFVHAYIARRA